MRDLAIHLALAAAAAAMLAPAALPAAAARLPPSLQDSFPLGGGAGVLCRVQSAAAGPAIRTMFDRAYTIVCRDAAAPVGHLYALRRAGDDPLARLAAARDAGIACAAPTPGTVADLAGVQVATCGDPRQGVGYTVYSLTRGRTVYVAEGLAGYDSALELGLRTIVADRIVPGEIAAATTSVADPAAFARVQAGTLDPAQALAEGYRRNNAGSYAEAAEFFDTLVDRSGAGDRTARAMLGEYIVNRALQRSNLGQFAEADALFDQARGMPTADPVQLRLRRNFLALHLLNEGRLDDAAAVLRRPMAPLAGPPVPSSDAPYIDAATATRINSDTSSSGLPVTAATALTPAERGMILDAQAVQARGTVLRLKGELAGAEALLLQSNADALKVREGRVTTIARLRAQTLAELSAIAEARGDQPAAERLLREGMAIVEAQYPRSAAALGARARLAGYLARRGQADAAIALYREVVARSLDPGASAGGLQTILAPYFALLANEIPAHPALTDDLFVASQTLVRPGVADTQAVLARELSGGSDEAARLFRQSLALTRDIERARVEIARLAALPKAAPDDAAREAALRAQLAGLAADQTATQAKLSTFPRYRAVAPGAMTLADLQRVLRPGEAYFKLAVVGGDVYAIWVSPTDATAYRAGIDATALGDTVSRLRDSIVREVAGQPQVYPFDIAAARALFVALMQPVADRLGGVKHLIFEPDGAMLELPANLLVTDDASVAAYQARLAKPGADDFDFRGTAWLGRELDVSTAVSARGFRDVRAAAPSRAPNAYLGLGQNAPVANVREVGATRAMHGIGGIDCDWPLYNWDNPIPASELLLAERRIGRAGSAIVTGAAFSDTALMQRTDLASYRILHFATHGLVTAPRPECPARPALLTSFGPTEKDGTVSDGLLSFREIYDLGLDADLVILSACDTAGAATVGATREAGITTGGGTSLDGLVRAFVGAGGRSVLASHWPVPNDYDATGRLIGGLFTAPAGTGVGEAMRMSELKLMDDQATSHPYYWAAFAIVGDGNTPVIKQPL